MGLYIMKQGWDDGTQAASVESLAGCESWREDLERFAPWRSWKVGGRDALVSIADRGRALGQDLLIFGPCSSSLDLGRKLVEPDEGWEGMAPFSAMACLSQESGRGQLRRQWVSPPGNLYAAMAWPGDVPERPGGPPAPGMTSLAVGLAVARGLEMFGARVEIKWPNDLLLMGRKVGGILVEERGGKLLAGIGVNLSSAPDSNELREGHAFPAGSLAEAGIRTGPISLLAAIQKEARAIAGLTGRELAPMVDRRLAWKGCRVMLPGEAKSDFDKTAYTVVGIAGDGALRLSAGASERLVNSGSIIPLDEPERR